MHTLESQQTSVVHEDQPQSTPRRSDPTKEYFLSASRQVPSTRERDSPPPETPTRPRHALLSSSNAVGAGIPSVAHPPNTTVGTSSDSQPTAPQPCASTASVATVTAANGTGIQPTQIPQNSDSMRAVLPSDIELWTTFPQFLIDRIFVMNNVHTRVIHYLAHYKQFQVQYGDFGQMAFVNVDAFFGLLRNENSPQMFCAFYW
jgi:hypothetical protein